MPVDTDKGYRFSRHTRGAHPTCHTHSVCYPPHRFAHLARRTCLFALLYHCLRTQRGTIPAITTRDPDPSVCSSSAFLLSCSDGAFRTMLTGRVIHNVELCHPKAVSAGYCVKLTIQYAAYSIFSYCHTGTEERTMLTSAIPVTGPSALIMVMRLRWMRWQSHI